MRSLATIMNQPHVLAHHQCGEAQERLEDQGQGLFREVTVGDGLGAVPEPFEIT